MKHFRLGKVATSVFLVLVALLFFLPIYLTILNSFKSMPEMTRPFYSFPERLALENFRLVAEGTQIAHAFLMSLIVVVISLGGILFNSCLASYAIARNNSLFNRVLYIVLVAGLMMPFTVIMIPLMKLLGMLKIANKYGLVLVYFGLGISFPIFLLTNFIKGSVPLELEESAYLDGAGNVRIFIAIVLPLLKPALATVITLTAVWLFNDFLLPSLLLSSKEFTIPVSQSQLAGMFLQQWNQMLAGFTIIFVPLLAFFLSLQRYFVRGVTEGALKG